MGLRFNSERKGGDVVIHLVEVEYDYQNFTIDRRMNMKKRAVNKILVFLLIGVCFILFSGSGKAESRLDTVIKRGKLLVGTRADNTPHGFADEKGELKGFDIDLGRAIAMLTFGDQNKVEFVRVSTEGRVLALVNGQVDYVQSAFTITAKRAQTIDFTMPILNSGVVAMVKKDSPIKKNTDLKGRKVAFRRGKEMEDLYLKTVPGMQILGFESHADARTAFAMGRADAVILSIPSAKWFIKSHPEGQKFRVILDRENPFEENQDAIGVQRGQQEWLNYLNLCLGILKKEGTYKKIFTQWFEDMEAAPQFFKEPL